jgi:hypothetical protein
MDLAHKGEQNMRVIRKHPTHPMGEGLEEFAESPDIYPDEISVVCSDS